MTPIIENYILSVSNSDLIISGINKELFLLIIIVGAKVIAILLDSLINSELTTIWHSSLNAIMHNPKQFSINMLAKHEISMIPRLFTTYSVSWIAPN